MQRNRIERIFYKFNPEYRHRYDIYNELLCNNLTEQTVWLDFGCGLNDYVADFGRRANTALGIDAVIDPRKADAPFLQADLRKIPLPSAHADLVTMRMVVEHLEKIPEDLSEAERLLKPGGKLIILATNLLSPAVFLPRLLPFPVKQWLIKRFFRVQGEDVFPTHHKFNTPGKIAKGFGNVRLLSVDYLEQVPLPNPLLTTIFGLWYTITRAPGLTRLRSNLLVVFEKRPM